MGETPIFEENELQQTTVILVPVLVNAICPEQNCGQPMRSVSTFTNEEGSVSRHHCPNGHVCLVRNQHFPRIDHRPYLQEPTPTPT